MMIFSNQFEEKTVVDVCKTVLRNLRFNKSTKDTCRAKKSAFSDFQWLVDLWELYTVEKASAI